MASKVMALIVLLGIAACTVGVAMTAKVPCGEHTDCVGRK